jgi:hypothetical protein
MGQQDDSINLHIVYTATTQDFMRNITRWLFQPFLFQYNNFNILKILNIEISTA